jgi:hypothetical protein
MFGADPDAYSVDVDSGAETEEEEGGAIAAKIEQRKKEEWNGDGEWKGKHNDICLSDEFAADRQFTDTIIPPSSFRYSHSSTVSTAPGTNIILC